MPEMEIHYGDGIAALYVGGKLRTVSDRYNVEKTAFGLANVKQVVDDAFMLGQDLRSGAAQNLEEIEDYETARELRKQKAKKLREEADALRKQADELEGK